MKIVKKIFMTILVITFCFILFLLSLDYLETPKSKFSTYSEAKASGMMDRGWIPTFIPKSAIDIQDTKKACNSTEYLDGKIKFNCEYFSNNVSLILYDNGDGELSSSQNYK